MTPRIIEINDRDSGSSARILVSQGFNCFSWWPMLDDGPREILWTEPGFASGDHRPGFSGIPILFPYPGRIRDARYTFGGREYQLEPGDRFGNAIHGFVYTRPWRVAARTTSRLVGEFQASIDDPRILEHWPSDFYVRVSYEVRGRQLLSDVYYENAGTGGLPCGFATHAYFRLPLSAGSDPEDTLVSMPAKETWEEENLLVTGRKLPVTRELDLRSPSRLAGRDFDVFYTGLIFDADGMYRARLIDPSNGRTITESFDRSFSHTVIYTPTHRQAICLEPYTCLADAFWLEERGCHSGLQILQPGAAFETTICLDVSE